MAIMKFYGHLLAILIVFSCGIEKSQSACTWPSAFASSTWWDSRHGSMTFTTTGMTGPSFTAGTTTINSWECLDTTYFDSEGILIMRSTQTFFLIVDWYSHLCLKMTAISPNSYRYYSQHETQPNAGNFRVTIATTNFTTRSEICQETNIASGAEFAVLVRQGSESSAKITCPIPLRGHFEYNYTSASGVVSCHDASQHMDVCTDKTKLTFPIPCAQSIVYAVGEVYCVDSVSVGSDTYVQLYNPQSTVDGSTTYKMSCMVISSDSRTASVVYKNCTTNMSPTSKARRHDGVTIGALIVFFPYVFCQGGCTWPATFKGLTWQDNTRGSLVFADTTMTGWSFTASDGSILNNWECFDNSSFSSSGILVIQATSTFSFSGGLYATYICLKMTAVVADTSYYYYEDHPAQAMANNERVYPSYGATTLTGSAICQSATIPTSEFHFMVKSGSASSAKQYCPPALLAKMDYSHTSASGTLTCNDSVDDWDVCTDRMVMSFDYSTCNTQMAYSATGTVYCMMNITSTDQFVVVYNTDASPTYQFACIASNAEGTAAAIVYNNCTSGMTSSAKPVNAAGVAIGASLTMVAKETCPFLSGDESTTTTTTTTSTTSPVSTTTSNTTTLSASSSGGGESSSSGFDIIPIIAAVLGLLLIIAIILITCYIIKHKKKNAVEADKIDEKGILPSGDVVGPSGSPMVLTDVDDFTRNPVFAVDLPRNTLTPLPPKEVSSDIPPAQNSARLPPIKTNFKTKA